MKKPYMLAGCLWALTLCAEPPVIKQTGDKTTIETNGTTVTIEKGADQNPDAQASGFEGSFTMNTTTTAKNGKSSQQSMSLYIRGYETALEMSAPGKTAPPMRMILNSQSNDVISLVNDGGRKTGMKMKMPKVTVSGMTDDQNKDCTVKKTSETKTIEGYPCTKYIITYSDGDVMEAWITEAVKLNLGGLMGMVNGSLAGKGQSSGGKYPNLDGIALEMTYTGNDGSTTQTRISNLKTGAPDASKFSTEGYEIMDMSQMGFPIFGQ